MDELRGAVTVLPQNLPELRVHVLHKDLPPFSDHEEEWLQGCSCDGVQSTGGPSRLPAPPPPPHGAARPYLAELALAAATPPHLRAVDVATREEGPELRDPEYLRPLSSCDWLRALRLSNIHECADALTEAMLSQCAPPGLEQLILINPIFLAGEGFRVLASFRLPDPPEPGVFLRRARTL